MALYFAAREFVNMGQSHDWWMSPEYVEAQSGSIHAGRGLLEIGENFEMNSQGYVATIFLYICAVTSAGLFLYYMYKYQKKQCGWEVIYVAFIETAVYVLELMWGHYYPAYLKICKRRTRNDHCIYDKHWHGATHFELNENDFIGSPWLRYCEWLMTCPVIIIALANLTGLKDDYNVRTMGLLTFNQAMIVFGVCASFSEGDTKAALFIIGCLNGAYLAYMAFLVYAEAYENVPPNSKGLVKYLGFVFFITWSAFPVIFLLGPATAWAIDIQGDIIAHCICDLFSKNLWGFLSLVLRDRVREHHRKLWFEEQARKQAGEKGFEVPKERRPSFRQAVSVFANAIGRPEDKYIDPKATKRIEDEVDPMYAEYRRRRRLRRGSLSAGGAGTDVVPEEDEEEEMKQQGDLQKAIQMLQAQQAALQQSLMQPPQPGYQTPALGQPTMGFPSPHVPSSVSPTPGAMPYISTPLGSAPDVIVADPPGHQFGAFFKAQLEAAAGARAQHLRSADDVFAALRSAASSGQRVDMLLCAEGLLDRSSILFVRSSYHVPVVVYGAEFQDPSLLGADEFLQLPRAGAPYSNDALLGACRRCMARRASSPAPGQQAGFHLTAAPAPGAAAAAAQADAPAASREELAAMLADLAKLRSHAASIIPVTAV